MENLLQGVNEARATLEAVGAEAELFSNVVVVAQLVSKLLGSHQDRWQQDNTSSEFRTDQRKPGECPSPVQATAEHSPGAKVRGVRKRRPQD